MHPLEGLDQALHEAPSCKSERQSTPKQNVTIENKSTKNILLFQTNKHETKLLCNTEDKCQAKIARVILAQFVKIFFFQLLFVGFSQISGI